MRAVLQRVSEARIEVGGETVGAIGPGLLALVGVGRDDATADARELAHKIAHLRIFDDAEGRMNRSLLETGGALAVVSQFTLMADCRKGRRPSFAEAAPPEQAEPLVEALIEAARALGLRVASGRFQAVMDVTLTNHGPVTICLETRKTF